MWPRKQIIINSFAHEMKSQEKQESHLKLNFKTQTLPGISPHLIMESTRGLNPSNIYRQMATVFF